MGHDYSVHRIYIFLHWIDWRTLADLILINVNKIRNVISGRKAYEIILHSSQFFSIFVLRWSKCLTPVPYKIIIYSNLLMNSFWKYVETSFAVEKFKDVKPIIIDNIIFCRRYFSLNQLVSVCLRFVLSIHIQQPIKYYWYI